MRLIDADNLYDDVLHDGDYENDTINHFLDMVSAQPDVDAEPVRHGEWDYINGIPFCSNCKVRPYQKNTEYCPNCGAKMDGKRGEKNEN